MSAIVFSAFAPVDQEYVFEARQMQALSFALHIPIVCFGIAFPAFVLFIEALWLRTGDPVYRTIAKRWSKVMLAPFAVGVVTGRSSASSSASSGRSRRPRHRVCIRALAAGAVAGAVALAGLFVVSLDAERLRGGLFDWPAILAVVASGAAGLGTLELVRRARFEAARYLASAAVAAIVVGWALAQRPELLPGLTVEEAAAERPVLIATIVGVALGAVILGPSLALLFGLVLRGRFDPQATTEIEKRGVAVAPRHRPVVWLTTLALAVGLP
ncbi:MAG: cytochrome ubiquinol oxidase subunit I [Actinomycetota bacterium]|nr:cytochrome ubiquinol oxidase subunit I [Actinomycetota bacterium]